MNTGSNSLENKAYEHYGFKVYENVDGGIVISQSELGNDEYIIFHKDQIKSLISVLGKFGG